MDAQCRKCCHWGNGDGTGYHYDAGNVNYCQHHLISGMQHPSSSSYNQNDISKLIVNGGDGKVYEIMTRWNFGCVLFKHNEK